MSDVEHMEKLPDTTVTVSYWALDSLLDWAEAVLIHCDELPWRISDDQLEELRNAQATGDEAVYGSEAAVTETKETTFDWTAFREGLEGEPTWETAEDLARISMESFLAENKRNSSA